MRRHFLAFGLFLSLGSWLSAGPDSFPLVAYPREASEGMNWDPGVVHMAGGQSFNGSLQGLGMGVAGIGYDLKGEWEMLEAHIGYTKSVSPKRRCKFSVMADQQTIYTSPEFAGDQPPERIRVSLEGKRVIMLRIEPVTYGGSLGACFANPQLKRGLTAADKAVPYSIEVNGRGIPYDQFSAPDQVPIALPVKPGEATYTVKVLHDQQQRKVIITTTP